MPEEYPELLQTWQKRPAEMPAAIKAAILRAAEKSGIDEKVTKQESYMDAVQSQ